MDFIDLKSQYQLLKTDIDSRIHKVLDHGQYILGPEVRELESLLEQYTGSKHCITAASGTEALLIALMALGVGPGDEVITTPFTFVATAEVIVLAGATPVFVDIEPDTYNIDPKNFEGAITPKTKAIIPVSLYGQVADMDEINAIATKHGITVLEDSAQSFGATYKGKKSGNVSSLSATSFFPSKPLGCYGDGGAIFTSDDALATAMREIRVHGQEKRYWHTRIGVGGRMDSIQCAVVIAKMSVFDQEVTARQKAADVYAKLLEAVPGVRLPVVRNDRTCAWAQYTIEVPDRDAFIKKMTAAGVPTAVHYPYPLHHQPAYKHISRISGVLKHSEYAAEHVVSLPMHPYLSESDQEKVSQSARVAIV